MEDPGLASAAPVPSHPMAVKDRTDHTCVFHWV
ncbi:rCG58870, isoform CRA_a [Rattus norvegicus]|uniref:RCG58870, isoform CRA_a n=1 Tax=Rattus norvegicus TaxID=10116 RepID=A6KRM4_RAT|nr:rCG58870, isoform CRA_a [Rattus norvegicus]